jgi:hypothetical protein
MSFCHVQITTWITQDNFVFIPNYYLPYTDKMSFPWRVLNILFTVQMMWGRYHFTDLPIQDLGKIQLGDILPALIDIARH